MKKVYSSYNKYDISDFNPQNSPLDLEAVYHTNTGYYFIKLKFNGIIEKETITKCIFNLTHRSTDTYPMNPEEGVNYLRSFEIYFTEIKEITEEAMQDFVDNKLRNLTADFEIEQESIIEGTEYKYIEQDLAIESITITEEEPTMTIVVVPSFSLNNRETHTFSCVAYGSNLENITRATKIDNYQYDDTVLVSVDKYNGNVLATINLFNTVDKSLPINLSIIGNSNLYTPMEILSFNLMTNYQYIVKKEIIRKIDEEDNETEIEETNAIYLKDYTGLINKYIRVTEINKEQYDKYFYHGIEGEKYFNNENGEVLYYTNNKLYIYDKNRTCLTIDITNINHPKVLSIVDSIGKGNYYEWDSNNYLLSISANNIEKDVDITYDTNNRISYIDYPKMQVKVSLTYLSYGVTIHYYKYDTSITSIKTITLNYTNNKITTISSSLNSDVLRLTYNNNQVQNIKLERDDQTIYSNTYEYINNIRKVTNIYGEYIYTCFDEYRRCIYELDNYGKSKTYEYYGTTDLINNELENINTRKLIENNSFEEIDSNDAPKGWTLTSKNGTSSFKLEDGIYGKSFVINLVASDTVTLSKRIYDDLGKINSLKGYIKHSIPSYQNVTINVNGKYRANGYETTINQTINTLESTTDWQEFKFENLGVPSNAQYVDIVLTFSFNSMPCKIMLDEITIEEEERTNRNNLILNGNMNITNNGVPEYWEFEAKEDNEVVNALDLLIDEKLLGQNVMRLIGTEKERAMSQTINKQGTANETYNFILFYKLLTKNEKIKPYIIVKNSEETEKYEIDNCNIVNEWCIAHKTITTKNDYSSIEVGVKYSGSNTIYVDNFQLYNVTNKTHYSYDDRNNITEISNKQNHIQYIYDDENRIKDIITSKGERYSYYYLNNKIDYIEDNKGNKINYFYDENGYVYKTTITYGDEEIVKKTISDSEGYLINNIDEFNNTSTIDYDLLKNVTKINYPNTLSLTSTYTTLNQLASVETTLKNTLYKNQITYTELFNVKEITAANGNKYIYEYDNVGHLCSIKANNILICAFEYRHFINSQNTGLVTNKIYSNTEKYSFAYDEKQRLTSVAYNQIPIVEFKYDESDNVCTTIDKINKITKHFTYDTNNRLTQVKIDNTTKYNYYYNKEGIIKKANYNINDKFRSYDYNTSTIQTFNSYIYKYKRMYNDDIIIGNLEFKGINGLTPIENNLNKTNYILDNQIPIYTFTNKNDFVALDISTANHKINKEYYNGEKFDYSKWQKELAKEKFITLWLKPKNEYSSINLLKLQSTLNESINLKINVEGYLEVYISNVLSFQSSNKVNLNKWNMLTLHITNTKVNCSLNGIEGEEILNTYTEFLKEILLIGYQNDNYIENNNTLEEGVLTTPFDICFLSLGNQKLETNILTRLYNDGLKLLSNTIDNIVTNTQYIKTNYNDKYEIFSLNTSLESNKREFPKAVSQSYKGELFEYDPAINNSALALYPYEKSLIFGGLEVKYDLNLSTTGMISLRFKSQSSTTTSEKTIIEIKDKTTSNGKLRVFIKNSLINIEVNGVKYTYYIKSILNNIWYTLTLFYNTSTLDIYVDQTKLPTYTSSSSILLNNSYTYLNSSLDGLVEQLVIYRIYVSSQNYEKIVKELNNKEYIVNHINEYDPLKRITKKEIKTNNTIKLSMNYLYNQTRVEEELMLDEYRKYYYNQMGNIQAIFKKSIDETEYIIDKEYFYDELGRLIESIDYSTTPGIVTTYIYGSNGSITNKNKINTNGGTISQEIFTYNTANPDLLIKVSGGTKEIKIGYGANNVVTGITKNGEYKILKYEGRRLANYGNNYYTYDEQGIRIKKQTETGNIHEYQVEGQKILSEIITKNNVLLVRLDYNYDINGELVSVEENGKTYFYIKDVLGIIHKIVDEEGNIIVKYTYDEWGVVKREVTCSSLEEGYYVAIYNSFIYKSYYYDSETQLFYCNSRYYSPELCRFISPDSIEYLDPQSINGLNLYCYCYNDPINYYDPSGHIAISTLIVGAIIGAVIGGATSAISQGLTKGWDNINGWQVLLDATIGGISGALGASGISQVVSMVAGGVLGAAGSIGGDLIVSGGDWSEVNVGKAILMGVIGVGLGRWTGAGTQNTKAMVSTINAGKSWGSKAFLTSAKEVALRPNSGLTLQTMYMNMAKAITKYTVQGISKVSLATFGSTMFGNMIGW